MKCRIAGCDAKVQDIRRHVKMHIRNSELHPEDLDPYTQIMRHGKRKTLVSKTISETKKPVQRRKRWYPIPDCTKICVRMNKHLQNVHKLKVGTVPYMVYLKEAKLYKGVMELDNPPRSVPGPSPSAAASAVKESPADCEDGSSTSGETNMCPPTDLESDSKSDDESSSSGSEYQPARVTQNVYFSATSFQSDRHKWLCGFYTYLGLPDAGYKKEAQRLQHASQVKLLLEALDPQNDDLACIGADNGDAVWVRWVDRHLQAKSKAPGMLISYLCSLELFLTYVTGRKYDPKQMPRLSPDLKDTFRSLIPALRGWRACVDSFTQDSQLRNYIAECDSLITTEEIKNLRSSKPYLEGANLIHMAERGEKLSLRQFTLVRNYLLTRLTLATGTRPGALNNVLVTDYETSRVSESNRIILVPKHKRTKDGPDMQKEMAVFVEKIRPVFANPDEDKLFIKDNGNGFPEGTIGKRVVAFFEKSGVTSTRVGHTNLRKFISTQTYERGDATEKVMSHGAITKRRCYVRSDCVRTASKAMQVIARVTSDPNPTSPTTSQQGSFIQIPIVDCMSLKQPLDEDLKLVISN